MSKSNELGVFCAIWSAIENNYIISYSVSNCLSFLLI